MNEQHKNIKRTEEMEKIVRNKQMIKIEKLIICNILEQKRIKTGEETGTK